MQRRPPEKAPLGFGYARVKMGAVELRKKVDPAATAAVFRTRLMAGDAFLKARLTDNNSGKEDDAKFAVFRYLGP